MVKNVLICGLAVLLILGLFFSIGSRSADAKIVGAWLLDEGSGDTARDSSGNGVDGVLTGSPEWVNGKFGKALKFDPSKYVDFPPPLSEKMILEKTFTCMAWMNPHKWESGWNCAFSMQAGSTGGETYGIYFGNQGGTEILCWTRIAGSGKSVTSGQGALDLGNWTHGAITYDGSKLIAYKNGEKAGETAVSGDLDNGDGKGRFVINGNYNSLNGGLGEWCSATIDEVLIFDEALTADEIKDYMENGFDAVMGGSTAVEPPSKLATTWAGLKMSQ